MILTPYEKPKQKERLRPHRKKNDWCVESRCPCLTCELWLNEKTSPVCACKPCNTVGLLRNPEDLICRKSIKSKRG